MSKTSRILSLVLALMLVLSLFSFSSADDEKVKLTAVTAQHSLTPSFDENPVWQAIEDAAGVEIEWETVKSDWAERRSVLIGTNSMPDLWVGEYNLNISHIQSNIEAFVRLNDYIDGSTNVKRMFDDAPELYNAVQFPDGSIYSIPEYQGGGQRKSSDCYFINKKWLDKAGLGVPTTLDEFYNALVAFKEMDMNENGDPNDEIPLVDAIESITYIANAFGIVQNTSIDWFCIDENDNLYWSGNTEAYKEACKFLAKIYQNGLCDPETFTQHWSEYYAYCAQEDAIGGVGIAWTIEALMAQHTPEYVLLPPVTGPEGKSGWNISGQPARPIGYAISASCQNQDAAWRVIETAYGRDFGLQLAFGEFGDHGDERQGLVVNEDGTMRITYPPEGVTWDTWTLSSTSFRAHSYVSAEDYALIEVTPDMQATIDIEEVYAPYMPEKVMPSCYIFDNDTNDELSVIKTDISSLMSQRLADWCTGALDIDADWEDYCAELEAYGLERYVEIYTERYNASK
jgi:putative aldouronate transport system substrate-binding protein